MKRFQKIKVLEKHINKKSFTGLITKPISIECVFKAIEKSNVKAYKMQIYFGTPSGLKRDWKWGVPFEDQSEELLDSLMEIFDLYE